MAGKHKVQIYLDILSPWSRVAFEVMKRYRQPWDLDLIITPINLNYIMKFAENRGPMSNPTKGKWMVSDVIRAVKFFGVTLNKPPAWPPKTQNAMSLLRLIQKEQSPEIFERALDVFFAAVWTEPAPLETAEQLIDVMIQNEILIGDEAAVRSLVERAFLQENKEALESEAKALVEQGGCFGAPWIVVTRKSDGRTENFFGSDRTEIIAAFLKEPYRGPRADGTIPEV